jgi:hypothetical protein
MNNMNVALQKPSLQNPDGKLALISWARMVGDTTFGGTTDKPQMTIPLEALLGKQ